MQLSRRLPATLQLPKHQEPHSAASVAARLLIRTHSPTPACAEDFCFPINYASGVATPVMRVAPAAKDLAEERRLIWNGGGVREKCQRLPCRVKVTRVAAALKPRNPRHAEFMGLDRYSEVSPTELLIISRL